MGFNSKVSARIIGKIKSLPGRIHAAGLEEAIFSLPAATYQDSGRAAFNWQTQAGLDSARVYIPDRGIPPVGQRGDSRTSTGMMLDTVSLYRVREARQLLDSIRDGGIKQSSIANPLKQDQTGEEYAQNAKIQSALQESKLKIGAAMAAEVKAWHKENS